jgi:hypothetical protein
MRIAALFVGRIRGYEAAFHTLQANVFAGHAVDVFYSHNANNHLDDLGAFTARLNAIPGTTVIRGESKKAAPPPHHESSNMWQMFYHLHNGIRIIGDHVAATDAKYDLILYLRADMHFHERVVFVTPAANTAYIPSLTPCADNGGICDQMAYGTLDAMTAYASTYLHMDDYCKRDNCKSHPETLTLHNIKARGLTVARFPLRAELDYRRKMNIALVFVGRFKGFERTVDKIRRNVCQTANINMFFSHNAQNTADDVNGFASNFLTVSGQSFYQSPPPHIMKYNDEGRIYANHEFMWQMFMHLNNGLALVRDYCAASGIVYDIVMYLRADMHIESVLRYPDYVDPSTIYIPNLPDWHGTNDQMAYGTLEAMTKYADTFNHLDEYHLRDKVIFHPEAMTKHNLAAQGLRVVRFPMKAYLDPDRYYDKESFGTKINQEVPLRVAVIFNGGYHSVTVSSLESIMNNVMHGHDVRLYLADTYTEIKISGAHGQADTLADAFALFDASRFDIVLVINPATKVYSKIVLKMPDANTVYVPEAQELPIMYGSPAVMKKWFGDGKNTVAIKPFLVFGDPPSGSNHKFDA